MRKIFLKAAISCALVCLLTACGVADHAEPTPEKEAPELPPQTEDSTPVLEPSIFQTILEDALVQCDPELEHFFAICDVDGDGADELIVEWTPADGIASSWTTYIYNHSGLEEFSCYGRPVFYGSCLEAPRSHSQGRSGDRLWPYDLYEVNDLYVWVASVEGWDRTLADGADWMEIPFPDEADTDGDGYVYYILTDQAGYAPLADPVGNAAYETWRDRYTGGAAAIDVPYQPLTAEHIAGLQS